LPIDRPRPPHYRAGPLSSRTSRSLRRFAVPFAAALTLAAAGAAHAASVRVPGDFYGVNFQMLKDLGAQAREQQLHSLTSLGLSDVRFNVSWAAIEPIAPRGGAHAYRWDATDGQIAAMARDGVRPQPTITQTPFWDSRQNLWTTLQCAKARSRAPLAIAPYVDFARAFAKRYGRGGTFWRDRPELPADPVTRYEIWNEPNLKSGWCPKPQPEAYAKLLSGSAAAIRSVDPNAQIVSGGVAATNTSRRGYSLGIDDFFSRVTSSEPGSPRASRRSGCTCIRRPTPWRSLGGSRGFARSSRQAASRIRRRC
jgi:hypothetical protein